MKQVQRNNIREPEKSATDTKTGESWLVLMSNDGVFISSQRKYNAEDRLMMEVRSGWSSQSAAIRALRNLPNNNCMVSVCVYLPADYDFVRAERFLRSIEKTAENKKFATSSIQVSQSLEDVFLLFDDGVRALSRFSGAKFKPIRAN